MADNIIATIGQNIVRALGTATQAYLNVQGVSTREGLTSSTVVKIGSGRLASVSVIVAGNATGMFYDATTIGDTTRPLAIIPMTAGVTAINLPVDSGIVMVPGSGQTVTVSWS